MPGLRRCNVCQEMKPAAGFRTNRRKCEQCRKRLTQERNAQSRYRISREEYEKERDKRKGVCDLCGKRAEQLVLDHDHVTGEIRGFIHNRCNKALGLLGDDLAGVEKAYFYLKGKE